MVYASQFVLGCPLQGVALHGVIWLLSAVKLFEIVQYVYWVLRKGSTYRQELLALVEERRQESKLRASSLYDLDARCRVPWPLPWRLQRRLKRSTEPISIWLRVLSVMNRGFGRWVHRQPILVLAVASLLTICPQERFVLPEIFLLLFLMFSELADTLCARAVLGFADNFRIDFTIDPTKFHQEDIHWSKTEFLGKFVLGAGVFLATSIIGFGAVYYGLYSLWEDCAFTGLVEDGTSPVLQLMYFSIVTMATVGYGDIHPAAGAVQMLAASEILFGIGVLVFLLFALSNTFTFE